jgi:hypothetical protein
MVGDSPRFWHSRKEDVLASEEGSVISFSRRFFGRRRICSGLSMSRSRRDPNNSPKPSCSPCRCGRTSRGAVKKATAFWDASALAPLCVHEAASRQAQIYLRKFAPVVWWGSLVEDAYVFVYDIIEPEAVRDGYHTKTSLGFFPQQMWLNMQRVTFITNARARKATPPRLTSHKQSRSVWAIGLVVAGVFC